jgi:hypothetical protein
MEEVRESLDGMITISTTEVLRNLDRVVAVSRSVVPFVTGLRRTEVDTVDLVLVP